MNTDIVKVEETNNAKWDNIANVTQSVSSAVSSIAELKQTCILAEKELALADRQIEQLVLSLESKKKDRELVLKQIAALHIEINKLIDASTNLMQRDSITELHMRLIEQSLNWANNALNKLPNL